MTYVAIDVSKDRCPSNSSIWGKEACFIGGTSVNVKGHINRNGDSSLRRQLVSVTRTPQQTDNLMLIYFHLSRSQFRNIIRIHQPHVISQWILLRKEKRFVCPTAAIDIRDERARVQAIRPPATENHPTAIAAP